MSEVIDLIEEVSEPLVGSVPSGKRNGGSKKSLQVAGHFPVHSAEKLAIEVQRVVDEKEFVWGEMEIHDQQEICQQVLEDFNSKASGSVSAAPPNLDDLLAAADDIFLLTVLLVFAFSVVFPGNIQLYILYSESEMMQNKTASTSQKLIKKSKKGVVSELLVGSASSGKKREIQKSIKNSKKGVVLPKKGRIYKPTGKSYKKKTRLTARRKQSPAVVAVRKSRK